MKTKQNWLTFFTSIFVQLDHDAFTLQLFFGVLEQIDERFFRNQHQLRRGHLQEQHVVAQLNGPAGRLMLTERCVQLERKSLRLLILGRVRMTLVFDVIVFRHQIVLVQLWWLQLMMLIVMIAQLLLLLLMRRGRGVGLLLLLLQTGIGSVDELRAEGGLPARDDAVVRVDRSERTVHRHSIRRHRRRGRRIGPGRPGRKSTYAFARSHIRSTTVVRCPGGYTSGGRTTTTNCHSRRFRAYVALNYYYYYYYCVGWRKRTVQILWMVS